MKTIADIDAEIKSLTDEATDRVSPVTPRKYKLISNKVLKLRQFRAYLETNPSEEVLKRQLEEHKAKLERINDDANYKEWLKTHPSLEKPIPAYHSQMGVAGIKKKIKTLTFLLD